jgi:ubiquinone biosynthesis protein
VWLASILNLSLLDYGGFELFKVRRPELKPQNHFARYKQIATVLTRYHLEEVLEYIGMRKYLPIFWMLRGNPWAKTTYSRPERIRMALEELGTTFVKIGQILSTRSDLLPAPYIEELSKLQNELTPLDSEVMKNEVSNQLGVSADRVFCEYDSSPIGVASIGQVYSCNLPDGTEIAVKVRKPHVPEMVAEDMDILKRSAVSATRNWKGSQQYDLIGIVQEISDTIKKETDYIQEGKNAEYFARFFQDDPGVHIPKIFWESTTEGVITMERIKGIGILNIEALDKAGFNRKELAVKSVDLWLKMVFEGEAFHADPHPGNLFVEPEGRLGLVDFGMVSIIDDEVRWHLVNTLKAILEKNVDLLIDGLIELGAVNLRAKNSRTDLRKDLKYLMRQFLTTNLQKHSGSVSSDLSLFFSVLQHNQMQLPSSTFLLLKTIAMAQSLGIRLDPDFDIIPMLEDYIRKLYQRHYSLSSTLHKLPSAAIELTSLVSTMPQRLDRIMKTLERGEIQFNADVSGVEQHLHHLEQIVNKTLIAVLASAIILALALFFVGWRLG